MVTSIAVIFAYVMPVWVRINIKDIILQQFLHVLEHFLRIFFYFLCCLLNFRPKEVSVCLS